MFLILIQPAAARADELIYDPGVLVSPFWPRPVPEGWKPFPTGCPVQLVATLPGVLLFSDAVLNRHP